MAVLVTGATGFVGRAVCAKLMESGYSVRRVVRKGQLSSDVVVPDLARKESWRAALKGAQAIVHLAALTHSGKNRNPAARDAFRSINVDTTLRLAELAAENDVGTVVFMSSIKVNGDSSVSESGKTYAYRPDDTPAPTDFYGQSKLDAERCLLDTLGGTDTRLAILRPPLVYGPGQKANMLSLMHLIKSGLPLPFSGVENQRSFIYVHNLADAVVAALARQQGQRCYTLADVTLSTSEFVRAFAHALNVKARLFPLPRVMLEVGCRTPGLGARLSRLCGNLVVDSSLIKSELGWEPNVGFTEGVTATAKWYARRA